MEWIILLLVAALVFGVCFVLDKLFTKYFRSKQQHKTGLAVRPNKRYASFGVILVALGAAALFMGLRDPWLMIAAGCVLIVAGICLSVYYLTFGVYYDEDTFLVSRFGKREQVYRFEDIKTQQLYIAGGAVVVELNLTDGTNLQVQSGMEGMYPFMDHAFSAWQRQKGLSEADCPFHDPHNSCWFPTEE